MGLAVKTTYYRNEKAFSGNDKGFRAIALIPVIEGTAVDIVTGKMQSGLHKAEKVASFEVKEKQLVEVSQRVISTEGMHN